MPIRITINGKPATANNVKNELELIIAGGPVDGLTRTVLDAINEEIKTSEVLLSTSSELWR